MLKDDKWLKQAFLSPGRISTQQLGQADRIFTDTTLKFNDTKLGGSYALNIPPASHGLADIKIKGRLPGNSNESFTSSDGLGLRYSEMIDDNSDLLWMRFGHQNFSGLTTFFNEFFDYEASVMARTGRSPSWFYTIGKGVAFIAMLPVAPIILLGRASKAVMDMVSGGSTSSSFMTLKPNMMGYWGSVSWMYNAIGVNMNLVYPYEPSALSAPETAVRDSLVNSFPELIDSSGLLDIFRVALRSQRLANEYRESVQDMIRSSATFDDLQDKVKALTKTPIDTRNGTALSYSKYADLYQTTLEGFTQSGDRKQDEKTTMWDDISSWISDLGDNTVAGLNDGADWMCLRVNHVKDFSMDWTNDLQDNPILERFNSVSNQARNTSSMLAGGNLGDGPITGFVESIVGAVKDTAAGAAEGFGISGVFALGGAGLIDVEKIPGDSSFSLPSTTYTVDLQTPSGSAWSEYLFIMPTVCALVAGTVPISTGKHSYTSPFICEAYMRGKGQIRRGLITSLTLKRATNNVGWTRTGRARGYTLEFTITDMSSVMHMPLNPMNQLWDGDTVFSDFLAVLSSLDMYHQLYAIPKLKLKASRLKASIKQEFSPAKMGLSFAESLTGQVIRTIARGTDGF